MKVYTLAFEWKFGVHFHILRVVTESKVRSHFIMTSVAILLGHLFILGLIASLIYKQRQECKLPRQSGSASIRVSTSSQLRLRMAVRKLFILTTVCILSDLTFIGVGFTTKDIITRTFRSTFYQISLLTAKLIIRPYFSIENVQKIRNYVFNLYLMTLSQSASIYLKVRSPTGLVRIKQRINYVPDRKIKWVALKRADCFFALLSSEGRTS